MSAYEILKIDAEKWKQAAEEMQERLSSKKSVIVGSKTKTNRLLKNKTKEISKLKSEIKEIRRNSTSTPHTPSQASNDPNPQML